MITTSASSIIAGCRKIIESLALVHPTVKWTLWEEKYAGTTSMNEPKKIINVHPVGLRRDEIRSGAESIRVDQALISTDTYLEELSQR